MLVDDDGDRDVGDRQLVQERTAPEERSEMPACFDPSDPCELRGEGADLFGGLNHYPLNHEP